MARATVAVRALARRDIESHYRWLVREAGVAVADRFLISTNRSFDNLAETPRLGPKIESPNPRVARLRKWKVSGFPGVIIFYEPRSSGVSIVRVIHAAQDWWRLIDA